MSRVLLRFEDKYGCCEMYSKYTKSSVNIEQLVGDLCNSRVLDCINSELCSYESVNMAFHILFGKNGSGKTRYLEQISNKYLESGMSVVSNLQNTYYLDMVDSSKINALDTSLV